MAIKKEFMRFMSWDEKYCNYSRDCDGEFSALRPFMDTIVRADYQVHNHELFFLILSDKRLARSSLVNTTETFK